MNLSALLKVIFFPLINEYPTVHLCFLERVRIQGWWHWFHSTPPTQFNGFGIKYTLEPQHSRSYQNSAGTPLRVSILPRNTDQRLCTDWHFNSPFIVLQRFFLRGFLKLLQPLSPHHHKTLTFREVRCGLTQGFSRITQWRLMVLEPALPFI